MNIHLLIVIQMVWFVSYSVVNTQNLPMFCNKWEQNNYVIRVYSEDRSRVFVFVDELFWTLEVDSNNRFVFSTSFSQPSPFLRSANDLSTIFTIGENLPVEGEPFPSIAPLYLGAFDTEISGTDQPIYSFRRDGTKWESLCYKGRHNGSSCGYYQLNTNGVNVTIDDIKSSISYYDSIHYLADIFNPILVQTSYRNKNSMEMFSRRVFYLEIELLEVEQNRTSWIKFSVVHKSSDLDPIVQLDPKLQVIGLFSYIFPSIDDNDDEKKGIFVIIRDFNVIKYCLLNDCLTNTFQELVDCNLHPTTTVPTTFHGRYRCDTDCPEFCPQFVANNNRVLMHSPDRQNLWLVIGDHYWIVIVDRKYLYFSDKRENAFESWYYGNTSTLFSVIPRNSDGRTQWTGHLETYRPKSPFGWSKVIGGQFLDPICDKGIDSQTHNWCGNYELPQNNKYSIDNIRNSISFYDEDNKGLYNVFLMQTPKKSGNGFDRNLFYLRAKILDSNDSSIHFTEVNEWDDPSVVFEYIKDYNQTLPIVGLFPNKVNGKTVLYVLFQMGDTIQYVYCELNEQCRTNPMIQLIDCSYLRPTTPTTITTSTPTAKTSTTTTSRTTTTTTTTSTTTTTTKTKTTTTTTTPSPTTVSTTVSKTTEQSLSITFLSLILLMIAVIAIIIIIFAIICFVFCMTRSVKSKKTFVIQNKNKKSPTITKRTLAERVAMKREENSTKIGLKADD